jgi:2-dehydropantoate 2-reductase
MKVGVMGAGAVGVYLGGRLAARGHATAVSLVSRRPLPAEVDRKGFTLVELGGEASVVPRSAFQHSTEVAVLETSDVVLCCVKSLATADAARQLSVVLRPGTLVVSFQNGVRNAEVLRKGLPDQIVLAGIVSFNVVPGETGEYRRTTSGPLVIEANSDPRVAELVASLERAGLPVRVTAEVSRMQWAKLVTNLFNAVSALSDVPTRDMVFSAGYRRVMAGLVVEALAVLRKAHVRPLALMGLPVGLLPILLRLPTPLLRIVARAQLKIDPQARSSMWEDLSKRRPTEVDDLNGEIVRLADSCGADAPLNRRMVELVHHYEREGRGSPGLEPAKLWKELHGVDPSATG